MRQMKISTLVASVALAVLVMSAGATSAQAASRSSAKNTQCVQLEKKISKLKKAKRQSVMLRVESRRLSKRFQRTCEDRQVCGLVSTGYSEGQVGIPHSALKTFADKDAMEAAEAVLMMYGACPTEEQYF